MILLGQEKHYFISIPDYICEVEDLTPLEKIVFGYIASLSYESGCCWASDKYIGDLIHYSGRQIRNAVNKLKSKGYTFVSYEYFEGSKNIKHRQIKVNDAYGNTLPQVRNSTSTGCGNTLPQGVETDFREVRNSTSTNNYIYTNIVEQSPTTHNYEIKEIVGYLNKKAGTSYKHSTRATQKHIKARLAEGYTVDDFKTVIDTKCADWKNTDYAKYLRPDTLFGSKFEGYLNEHHQPPQHNSLAGYREI